MPTLKKLEHEWYNYYIVVNSFPNQLPFQQKYQSLYVRQIKVFPAFYGKPTAKKKEEEINAFLAICNYILIHKACWMLTHTAK